MSLRARLIVAFLALSVVPLGAITWYSYSSNERALRDAAEHESDLLARELSQRMQVVTTQLSERVEHLMDMGEGSILAPDAQLLLSTQSPQTTPKPATPVTGAPAADARAAFEAQVAARLGEAAMLLNNVELPTFASGRGNPPAGRGRSNRGSPPPTESVGPTSGRAGSTGRVGSTGLAPLPRTDRGTTPGAQTPAPRDARGPGGPPRDPRGGPGALPRDGRNDGRNGRDGRGGPGGPSREARGGVLPSRPLPFLFGPSASSGLIADALGDGVKIDLARIRRDMFREIAPNSSPDSLTAAERQRIVNEVNQRLLGVVQGLKIGAAELQKQADEAKRQAVEAPKTASTITKKLALTGNRLNVSREQNGQVVNQVKAEINLPDLLATVFTVTPRERGEVPFAVDKDGRLYTQTEEDRKKIEALPQNVTRADAKLGVTQLQDWTIVSTTDPTGSGLRFSIARPVGEAMLEIRKTAARSAGLGLLFIAVALIGVVPISAGLTRNLSRLSEGVRQIASGDYRARVTVKTHDEIGELATAFNKMAGDVEHHHRLAIERERITRELELGRQIQHDMLPQAPLRVGATEIQGVSVAAGEVGGDFYNYFALRDGRIALLVGDVSGKGVGAALLMANIQASLRTRLTLGQELTALADELDRDVESNTPGPVYSTLFVGILNPSTRVLEYVNAGHNPQYVLRGSGRLERLESSGLPIGLLAGRGYKKLQIQLSANDVVFCYTDGCVEVENEKDEPLGAEALERELVALGSLDAATVLEGMKTKVRLFRGSREPFDDATMMVVKVG